MAIDFLDDRGRPLCCGEVTSLISSKEIYQGRDYGPMWICRKCGAYVGCHPKSIKPLGRTAGPELRRWKNNAHAVFDPMWKSVVGTMKNRQDARKEAYLWLSKQLDIPYDECHIGYFDIELCRRTVQVCQKAKTMTHTPFTQPQETV